MTTFTTYGARGSTPVSGFEFCRYGGQTTCFCVQNKGTTLIIDAGSGLTDLSPNPESAAAGRYTVLLTHFHIDHLIGLYACGLRYRDDVELAFVADRNAHPDWDSALQAITGVAFWPVTLNESSAHISYTDISPQASMQVGSFTVSCGPLSHPQGCTAYRISSDDGVIVVATDVELACDSQTALRALCKDCDLLVLDAQFTPDEYDAVRGWGHSTWDQAAAFAADVQPSQLLLTHHNPSRTDKEIDSIVTDACAIFPDTRAAYAGLAITLGRGDET